MTTPVRLAIVGCGGMGRRHLKGLAELATTDYNNVELVAACDVNRDNAEFLADEARELLGDRPAVFGDAEQMVREVEGLEAAACTTDSGTHHHVAAALLELGLHTQCEKPLAITVRGCWKIMNAAKRAGKVLAVAEQFRRDPINRLARALIDDGAIGEPQFMMEVRVHGGNTYAQTPWRHTRGGGGIILDYDAHTADILQYYLGTVESVYGRVRLFEKKRYKGGPTITSGYWEQWKPGMASVIEADSEDAMFGLLTFENGAMAQWVGHHAGHGQPLRMRTVFGTRGSFATQGDRDGRPIRLVLDDGTDLADGRILEYAPSYRLSPLGATLLGNDRPWRFDDALDFLSIDAKLVALEYHDFAESIRSGGQPEVDGAKGLRAVALVCAAFESDRAGRPVRISEVESGMVDGYQREIDQHLGLMPAPM